LETFGWYYKALYDVYSEYDGYGLMKIRSKHNSHGIGSFCTAGAFESPVPTGSAGSVCRLSLHTVPPPIFLSPFANRAPDGTLPIATCLVLLFIPCSHLYPSSSLCWPWPAQGSHTIPLGSSAHRRCAALSDVKPHRTVQRRPIRRPATATSLQASSHWFSQATSSESPSSSFLAVGSIVLMVVERTSLLSP